MFKKGLHFFLTKSAFYSTLLPADADAENKNGREPKDGYSVEHSSVGTPLVFLKGQCHNILAFHESSFPKPV
jgi:hypothetical protein